MADAPDTPASTDTPTCCGDHGGTAGGPIGLSCQLCPRSPTYWRLAENRGDGKPYVEGPPTY